MATPLTHLILTDKIYKDYFARFDKKDFILWTLLPDIRYLDTSIPRERTHISQVSLLDILTAPNSFDAWILFHSFLDHVRDAFYIKKWVYIPGENEDFIIALKLLEDQYLFGKISNRSEYITLLNIIPYDKVTYIKKEILATWYDMIQKSIPPAWPNDVSRRVFQAKLGLPEAYTDKVNHIIHHIQQDPRILELIDELYTSFWSLIRL